METKKKTINGCYRVADCEHNGDMEWARSLIKRNVPSVTITESYWDGRDCGEAYIKFSFPSRFFKKVYAYFEDSSMFDADINDYVKANVDKGTEYGKKEMSKKELQGILCKMKADVSEGWEDRLPICLNFAESKNIQVKNIIEEALSRFSEYEIVAYNTEIVDGSIFHTLLFTTPSYEINQRKFEDFGDSLLFNNRYSYLKKNKIYGYMAVNHILKQARHYDDFFTLMARIVNKMPLPYKNIYRGALSVTYAKYAKDGILRESIYNDEDGLTYTLPNCGIERYLKEI